jgi:flagellar hook assembly protein FlgD
LKHKNTETIKATSDNHSNSKKSLSSKSSNDTSTNSVPPSQSTYKNTPASSAALVKPYGTVVSNHHPNLSGSPAPSSEESVCQTAPGATCYIQFTKGSTVKKLPAEKADSSGSANWNWDVKQAGFSTGSWTIQAVASLNGKTMTAQDDLKLEVQP